MNTLMGRICLALIAWVGLAGAANGDVGPSELWKINADGTGLMRFVDTPGETCGSPEWSPDGKFAAFGAWRVDQNLYNAHIFVIGADGTGRRDLGPGAMASWSPDGKQLVFHTYPIVNGDNSFHIVVINAEWLRPQKPARSLGQPALVARRQSYLFDFEQ